MNEEIRASDVIIFYGPPYCGKTFYYGKYLSKSHVRVAPPDEFAADPDLTLRQLVISKVVSQLKQGKKIVIDDENSSAVKRDAYVSLIKKKCPASEIICLKFCPRHGSIQLHWQQEFSLAAVMDNTRGENGTRIPQRMCESDVTIEQWTERPNTLDPPNEREGYRYIKEVSMLLHIKTVFKLEVPCLFIQYEALFDVKDKAVSRIDKAALAITKWYENNPCGRVTVLCDGQAISSGSFKDQNQKLKDLLKSLANEIPDCPVYLLHITDAQASGLFMRAPQPGMLAFLQYIHTAHLTHKATMYWYHTPAHVKMAHNAGVKHIKASRVLQHIQLAATSHGTATAPEPDILKDLEVTARSDSRKRMLAVVPLYEVMEQSLDGVGSMDMGCGRMLYMAVGNNNVLQRYQDLYAANATPVEETDSKIGLLSRQTSQPVPSTVPSRPPAPLSGSNTTNKPQRDLPKWMLPKSEEAKDKLLKGRSVGRTQGSSAGYIMNTIELIDTAKIVLREAGEAEPTDEDIASHISSGENDGSLMDIFSNTKEGLLDHHLPRVSQPARDDPVNHNSVSSLSGDILDDLLDLSSVKDSGFTRKSSQPVRLTKETPRLTRTSGIITIPETTSQEVNQQTHDVVPDSFLGVTGPQTSVAHLTQVKRQKGLLSQPTSDPHPGSEAMNILASETVTTVPETSEIQRRSQPTNPPRKKPRIMDTSILDDLL